MECFIVSRCRPYCALDHEAAITYNDLQASYSQMFKSRRHSIFEAFTWGFESVEVVAMLRLVGEKLRQQRQTKQRSQQTSGETRRKEGRKERKKDRGDRIYMMR